MDRYGLSQLQFTEITDGELDEVVEEITREYPSCGEGLLKLILAAREIQVQRTRLRDSIHRVDHENTSSDNSATFSASIFSEANFVMRDSSLRSFRILSIMFFFFHERIGIISSRHFVVFNTGEEKELGPA